MEIILGIIGFISIIFCPIIAYKKNRSVVLWAIFGLFLPLLSLLIIAFLPKLRPKIRPIGEKQKTPQGVSDANSAKRIFKCIAGKDGQVHVLKLDAINKEDAIRQLKERNFEIISLKETNKSRLMSLFILLGDTAKSIFNPRLQEGTPPPKEEETSPLKEEEQHGDTKKCPYCSEEIKYDAVKCRYCGETVSQKDFSKLMLCPDCKKEISTQAIACPHCGYQVQEVAQGMSGCGLFLLIVGAIIVAFLILYWQL